MTISAKLKRLLGRVIRGVPPGHPGCLTADVVLPKFDYCPASELSPVSAASAEPWRTNYITGEQWYRVPLGDGDVAPVADDDDPDDADIQAIDDDDPADDFDDFDDDLDGIDAIDGDGYPINYPEAWKTRRYD